MTIWPGGTAVTPSERPARKPKGAALGTEHEIRVHVARTFSMKQAGEAHRFLETAPIGKVVLVN